MADGSGSNEPSVARGVTGESARPGSAGGKSAPVVIGDGETTPPVNASTYSGGYSNRNCNTSVSALNGNRGTPSSAPPRTAPHITPQTSPNPPLHVDTLPTSPIVPSSTSSSTVPTINTDWIQQYGFTEIGFDDFVNVVGEIKNVPGVGSMERYRYLIGEVKVLLEDVERADPAVPKQHFSAVAAAMTVGRSLDVGQAIQRYWNAMVHAREQHGQGQQAPAQTQQGQVQQVQGQQVQGQQSQAREVQAQQAQAQRVQAQQGQAGREQAQQVQEYQPRGNASPADIAAQATRKVYTPQPQHSASTTHGPQHFTRPSPSTAAQRMPGPQYVQVPSQGMQSGSHAGSVPSRQQGASSTSPTKQTIPLQGQPTRLNGQIMQCSQPSRQIRQGPPPPPPVIRGPLDPTGGQAYYAQPVNAPIAQGPQSGHAGPSRRMTDPQQHTAAGAQLPLRKSGYGAVQASPPVPATSALLAPTAPSPPNNASAMGVAALAGIEDAYKQMQDNLSKQMEATWNTFLEPSNAVLKQLTDLVKLQATQLDVLNAQIDERVLDQATGITAHIAADGEIARLKEVNSALVAGHARDLQKEKALNAQSTSRHAATLDKLKADIKAEQDKSANLARERDNTKAQLRNAELAAQRAEREVQLARDNAAWDPNRPELHRKMSAVGEGASGAEDEIASLRKKLDARTAKMTALERERKAEVDGLQAKLEKADKIAADLKVDLLREKQSVAVKVDNQVKDRLIDLKMKMREELDEEVQGTIKRLGDDNDDLAEQLDMEKAAVHSLTLTVARLERAVPLDGDVAAVAEELATTKTALAEAKAENTDIYAQVTEAMDRTKSEKDRADRNADQVARLEQQLSSAGMRLKDLETSVDSADNRIRSAETNARTASAHLDDTKKQLESLNTEVARLKAVEATVQTLRSERDASLENVRQIQSAHTDAINRLRELIQVLVEVRQYLGVEDPTTPTMSPEIVAAVSQDVRTALKQLQDSRAQRIAQEAAAATLQTALDTEIAISSSLRSQLAQERMQHGEAEAALSTLKGTIDKLEKAREDSRTAADKARTHLAELAAQGAELKELREKYTRTKQELDTALKALDDKEGEEVADLVGMVSPESDNTPTMSAGPKAPVPAVKVSVNRPMLCERGDSTQTMAVPPQGPAIAGAVLTAATGNPGQLGSDTFTSPLNDVKGIASQAPPERGQQKAPASVSPATEVNKIAPVPSGPNVNTSNSTTSNATPAKTPFRSTSAASYSTTPSSRPNGNKQTSGPVSTSAVGVPAAPVTGTTSTNAALVAGSGVATTKPASKSRWVTNTPTESAVPNGSAGTPAPRTKSAPSPVKTATAPRPSIGTIKTPASTQRRTDLTPSKVDRPTPAAIHTEVKGPSSIHAGKAAGFRSSTSPTPPLSSRQASPKVPEAVSSPAVSPKLTKTPASAVTAAASTAPPASPAAPAATSLEKRKDETASSSNAQGKRDSATPALALAPALSQKRAREEPLFSPGQEEQEEAEVGSASQKREAKKARQLIKSPAAGSSQLKQISVDSDTEDEAPQRPTQPMTSAARLAQNNGIMRSLTPSTPTPASSGFKAALGGSQSVPRLSTSSRSTDTTGSASQRSALSSSSGANTPKTSTKAGVSATGGSTSTPSTSTFTPASSSKAPSASQPVRQRQSLPASSSSSAARSASQRPATPSLNGLDRSASVASTLRAETPLSSQAMRTAVSPMPPNGITREWIMGNLKCCQKRHVSGKGMVCKCCFLQLDKAERSSKYNNEPANYTPMAVMSETERIDHYMTHAEKLWGVRERRIREGKEADFR